MGWTGLRRMIGSACLAVSLPAQAGQSFVCNGFAMTGGAQLLCSHVEPMAPPQVCTFGWSLMGPNGQTVVTGSFLLSPGQTNATVYQGSGFNYALSPPIILCQGRRHDP